MSHSATITEWDNWITVICKRKENNQCRKDAVYLGRLSNLDTCHANLILLRHAYDWKNT